MYISQTWDPSRLNVWALWHICMISFARSAMHLYLWLRTLSCINKTREDSKVYKDYEEVMLTAIFPVKLLK